MSGTDASDREEARGATESHADAAQVVGEGSDAQKAREARYAEAIYEAKQGCCEIQRYADLTTASQRFWQGVARAVMAVADAELEQARAEVERLRRGGRELGRIVDWQCKAVLDATGMDDWTDIDGDGDWAVIWEALAALRPRAEAAESALTEAREQMSRLVEAVKGLAMVGETPDGEPLPEWVHVSELERVLADVAPTAGDDPAEQEAGEIRCPVCGKGYADCDAYLRDEGAANGVDPASFCQRGVPLRLAPSGSDEQGDSPATPDANGVQDTKGGE